MTSICPLRTKATQLSTLIFTSDLSPLTSNPPPDGFAVANMAAPAALILPSDFVSSAFDFPGSAENYASCCSEIHYPVAMTFDRITFDPAIMGGRACIRGMRIPVSVIVGQLAHGATAEELLAEYPDLEKADVQQALEYAAWLTQEEVLPA